MLTTRASERKAKNDRDDKAAEVRAQLVLAAQLAELKAEKMFRDQSHELAGKIAGAKEQIQDDLAKNTEVSVQAFQEANHVNIKITDLQNVLIEQQKELKKVDDETDPAEGKDQQDSIQGTVEDTNRVVHKASKKR